MYSGPSEKNYASIGSIDALENIGVIHQENDWLYIVYSTSGGLKRGFVPISSINNGLGISNNVQNLTNGYIGWSDMTNIPATVYAGPDSLIYTSVGAVAANEGVTVFSGIEEGFIQIEYTTSAGPKRGYISYSGLHHRELGGLAIVMSDKIIVHYTPDLNTNPQYGAVATGEFVIVLEKNNSICYIEYNTSSGRKRGYTSAAGYQFKNMGNVNVLPNLGNEYKIANGVVNVYAGPSDQYALIGTLNANEPVVCLNNNIFYYEYIQYTGSGITKRGYVKWFSLLDYYVVIPDFSSIPYVQSSIYGVSGMGNLLKYYSIGNGSNHLILNFAIHGFEDYENQDGMELVHMAGEVLQALSDNYSLVTANNWTVYVIPTSNPDGLLSGTTSWGPGRCTVKRFGSSRDETVEGGIDINRSFEYLETVNGVPVRQFWPRTDSPRNYTGPEANWSVESEALKGFIDEHKSGNGVNVFIDNHGWTNQIIVKQNSSSNKLYQLFNAQFHYNVVSTFASDEGRGYVARYAEEIAGMDGCLFEFPDNVTGGPGDLVAKGYNVLYINVIKNILSNYI